MILFVFSFDDNSMDYSSQDSNPLDFSRNNKDLLHQHLIAQGMMSLAAAADENHMRHHPSAGSIIVVCLGHKTHAVGKCVVSFIYIR